MNVQMLAKLRAQGVYLVPSVPNTTHVSHETDQNYSLFKSDFYRNLTKLTEFCYARNETLTMTDLPMIVFGAQEGQHEYHAGLVDAFQRGFNRKKIRSPGVW